MPSINDLVQMSFYPAVRAERRGRNWITDELNQLREDGRIRHRPLNYINDNIVELHCPITWSKRDELLFPTERAVIDFVTLLIENGLQSMEYLIGETVDQHPDYRFVFNQQPYWLQNTIELPDRSVFMARIYCPVHLERT